jgi:hypothetical protein
MSVSQPLVAFPSQLPQPALQVGTQALPVQVVVPCALLQAVPQAPQFDALLLVSVSQPVVGLPSQLRQVPVQTGTHTLPEQLVVPCAFVHAVPHAPQFAVLLETSVSQPLALWFGLLQSRYVPMQPVYRQLPPLQDAAGVLWTVSQVTPLQTRACCTLCVGSSGREGPLWHAVTPPASPTSAATHMTPAIHAFRVWLGSPPGFIGLLEGQVRWWPAGCGWCCCRLSG